MGSEVLRIDLLCFLTGCCKKATKPGCLYLFLNIVFLIVLLFIEATFCVLLVMLVCVLSSLFWFRCK